MSAGTSDSRWTSFGRALRTAAQWRLLVVWTVGILLPTAIASVPAWRLLAHLFDHSPRASELAQQFDILAFSDVAAAFARAASPLVGAAGLGTIVAWLIAPLLAGVTIGAGAEPATFSALLTGGIARYGRLLRLMLVSLVPLAVTGAVAALAFKLASRYAGHALFESRASWAWRGATVVTLLVFVVLHATLEAGRARMGVDDGLRSAWRAWFGGVKLALRRPLAVLGSYLGATLAGFLIALPLLVLRFRVAGATVAGFSLAFVVTQFAVAALGWGRAARLLALVEVARREQIVAPTLIPRS
jgi:hypothetical protein